MYLVDLRETHKLTQQFNYILWKANLQGDCIVKLNAANLHLFFISRKFHACTVLSYIYSILFYYYVTDLTRLKRIMRHETGVTVKWYDIGVELLSGNIVALDEIQAKYSSDVNKCCTEMFKKWLQHNPVANWDQLASVLSEVKLNTAAENIKGEFTDYIFELGS